MKNKILLPNKYKKIGWLILIPATALGIVLTTVGFDGFHLNATMVAFFSDENVDNYGILKLIHTDVSNTIVGVLFIIGALMVAFSKEKNEDEYIAGQRLSSLLWAVLVNYLLLLLAFLFVYGLAFIDVMLYNMFTVLIIFIARFNYVLHRDSKLKPDEKYN